MHYVYTYTYAEHDYDASFLLSRFCADEATNEQRRCRISRHGPASIVQAFCTVQGSTKDCKHKGIDTVNNQHGQVPVKLRDICHHFLPNIYRIECISKYTPVLPNIMSVQVPVSRNELKEDTKLCYYCCCIGIFIFRQISHMLHRVT